MTTNILICDDVPQSFTRIKRALGGGHEVTRLVGDKLQIEIETLFQSISTALSSEHEHCADQDVMGGSVFDGIDVAIIDNNLSELRLVGERLTAEAMIGYVRAFTDIPYIVSLNKNPDVDFDLRYMVGDYQTHADLALNTRHLSYRALWQNGLEESGADVFAPSYWPNLHEVALPRRKLIEKIESRLDDPILEVLDFSANSLDALSRHAKGALSPKAITDESLREVTCIGFFKSACRSLPPKERKALADSVHRGSLYAKAIARLVAADLEKWVRRDALAPQDVLIDLPHLLARMPFLLGKDADDVRKWNGALNRGTVDEGALEVVSDAATKERIGQARFTAHGMYMRWPCFWWRDLKDDDRLSELFFSSGDQWADAVFCEDVSRFVDLSASDGDDADSAQEFEAEFDGAWSRRYVRQLPRKLYSPRSRLAI